MCACEVFVNKLVVKKFLLDGNLLLWKSDFLIIFRLPFAYTVVSESSFHNTETFD